MKVKTLLAIGIVMSLGALTGTSWGQAVYLSEGFETVPGSTDTTGDFDPPANGNPNVLPGSQPINETTPEGIQVRTLVLSPGPAEGNQFLRIAQGDFYIPYMAGIPNTAPFSVTLWVYNTGTTGFEFQIGRINTDGGPNIGFQNVRWSGGMIQSIQGGSWTDIVPFTPGQWDRVGLEFLPSGGPSKFDLYINNSLVANDVVASNPGFFPPLNNIFLVSRSGDVYLDELEIFEGTIPAPTQVDITLTEVADVFGLSFTTEVATTYRLESTTDLVTSNNFQSTGALLQGNGTVMEMFDPTGFSTTKAYRVVIP